jgi:hypothetical protein
MTRAIAWILPLMILPLSGCGEAERPRFVPASNVVPTASADDRRAPDRADRGGAIPKNIPMH